MIYIFSIQNAIKGKYQKKISLYIAEKFLSALHELQLPQASIDYVLAYNYEQICPMCSVLWQQHTSKIKILHVRFSCDNRTVRRVWLASI